MIHSFFLKCWIWNKNNRLLFWMIDWLIDWVIVFFSCCREGTLQWHVKGVLISVRLGGLVILQEEVSCFLFLFFLIANVLSNHHKENLLFGALICCCINNNSKSFPPPLYSCTSRLRAQTEWKAAARKVYSQPPTLVTSFPITAILLSVTQGCVLNA